MILYSHTEVVAIKNGKFRTILSYSQRYYTGSYYITSENFYSYLLQYQNLEIKLNIQDAFFLLVSGLIL